jgi:hypothetical protein
MYWYCAHNIVWWLLLRVVVVVVVAMPLVRGDVGVRSAFFVCGLWFAVRAVHNLILLAKTIK